MKSTNYPGSITKAPDWHALVAWDMLFNNLATGLFLVAALGELVRPAVFTPVARVAYPIALLFLLVDLTCLVLDLGDPLRFHHMLRIFKPTSPMSLGTWCLTVYSFPLTVAAAISVLPTPASEEMRVALEWARKGAVVLALLPALGSALYKGVLLSTTAQPGWKDARWLGAYLTSSAFMLGCASLLVIAVVTGQEGARSVLVQALLCLLLANGVFLCLLFANLQPTLGRIYETRKLWSNAALVFAFGLLLPLCLTLTGSTSLLLSGVLFLLLGSLAIRFVIVKVPHALMRDQH